MALAMRFRMSTQEALADIPSYRRHKASGQAVVTRNGVDPYLGRFNPAKSRAESDRVFSCAGEA
jgi:hypothetical protein